MKTDELDDNEDTAQENKEKKPNVLIKKREAFGRKASKR